MYVGTYLDLRNPQRWRRDPTELYGAFPRALKEIEHVGLDSIGVTEHHGFDGDRPPDPPTIFAAAAVRTSLVRPGTGIVIAALHEAGELVELGRSWTC